MAGEEPKQFDEQEEKKKDHFSGGELGNFTRSKIKECAKAYHGDVAEGVLQIYKIAILMEKAFIEEKERAMQDNYAGRITEVARAARFDDLDKAILATKDYISQSLDEIARLGQAEEGEGLLRDANMSENAEVAYQQVVKPLSLGEKFMLLIERLRAAVTNSKEHNANKVEQKEKESEQTSNFGHYPVKQTASSLIKTINETKKTAKKPNDKDDETLVGGLKF